MTTDQAYELETLHKELRMSDGTLLALAREAMHGQGCGRHSLADLTRYQTGALIGRLREIQQQRKVSDAEVLQLMGAG